MALSKFYKELIQSKTTTKGYFDEKVVFDIPVIENTTGSYHSPIFSLINSLEDSDVLVAKSPVGNYYIESGRTAAFFTKNKITTNATTGSLKFNLLFIAYLIASDENFKTLYKEVITERNEEKMAELCLVVDEKIKQLDAIDEILYNDEGNFNVAQKGRDRLPAEQRNQESYVKFTNQLSVEKEILTPFSVPKSSEFSFLRGNVRECPSIPIIAVAKVVESIKNIDEVIEERNFTEEEQKLLDENKARTENYILTEEARELAESIYYCKKAGFNRQAIALSGSAGMGKTVSAQKIANLLNRPYVHFICSESTVAKDFAGEIESIQDSKTGKIQYKDSPIVKALKYGWVCEVQEFSLLQEPAAAGWFNPILDETKCFYDAENNKFDVHPDALLIFTYNPNYVENKQCAQATLNRIPLKAKAHLPEQNVVVDMLKQKTGYTGDDCDLVEVYKVWCELLKYFHQNDIDEVISIRNLREWVISRSYIPKYANENDWYGAAQQTVIYSVGDRDESASFEGVFTETQENVADIIRLHFPERK